MSVGTGTVLLWDMSLYITGPLNRRRSSAVEPNYPNPFNASTYLIYRLAAPGAVRLKIYNTLGQPGRTLVRSIPARWRLPSRL